MAGSVRSVDIVRLFDSLPESVNQPAPTVWSVFARSLGEQGASGRTALAWRWAFTGACPSPVTLSPAPGQPPTLHALLGEAEADAELAHGDADPGGQVMHGRFVLRWLAGDLDALPLWNGGPKNLHVTEGAAFARPAVQVEEVHAWAMLAEWRHPWPTGNPAPAETVAATGAASGAAQLFDWVCGVTSRGPLAGTRSNGQRPSLYEVSLDVRHAMTALVQARQAGSAVVAARIEAIIETFAWLAGWEPVPPVDRHGHVAKDACSERQTVCSCGKAGRCLSADCPACRRVPCVHGFGQAAGLV